MSPKKLHSFFMYLFAFARWMLTGILIGALCGVVGAVFAICVEKATHLRQTHDFLIYLLPAAGISDGCALIPAAAWQNRCM